MRIKQINEMHAVTDTGYLIELKSNYKSELGAAVMRDCLARDLGYPIDSMNFNGKI